MTDLVADATAELYSADPDDFTLRRTALAKAARASGDPDAAKRITALRKPTRAAWLLNRLTRLQPEVPAQLAELANGLRDAERSLDGGRLRELSEVRSALVDEFTNRALADLGEAPYSLREDVSATLSAAIADPAVASDLVAGTLTKAVHWAGFGTGFPPSDIPGLPTVKVEVKSDAVRESARERHRAQAALREAEERNKRQRQIQDAERAVANAATVSASAAANEEQLEDTVRDLEQRLTAVRAELSDARLRARRAEAAERKARQALDRLTRSPTNRDNGPSTRLQPREWAILAAGAHRNGLELSEDGG